LLSAGQPITELTLALLSTEIPTVSVDKSKEQRDALLPPCEQFCKPSRNNSKLDANHYCSQETFLNSEPTGFIAQRKTSMRAIFPCSLGLLLLTATAIQAKEYPIGAPQQCEGLEISAVYLQPIEMEPAGMMRSVATSDVHLESDIRALADNRQGF
jgi:hypothetical protein